MRWKSSWSPRGLRNRTCASIGIGMGSPRNEGPTIPEADPENQSEREVAVPKVVLCRPFRGRACGRPPPLHAEVVATAVARGVPVVMREHVGASDIHAGNTSPVPSAIHQRLPPGRARPTDLNSPVAPRGLARTTPTSGCSHYRSPGRMPQVSGTSFAAAQDQNFPGSPSGSVISLPPLWRLRGDPARLVPTETSRRKAWVPSSTGCACPRLSFMRPARWAPADCIAG